MRNKIVINADDYSMNPSADERILTLLKERLITSISITATSPNFNASVEKIRDYDGLIDIGVHLELKNLASITPEQAHEEFEAQVQKCIDTGLHITHIDNHRPEIYFFPELFSEVIKLASTRGLFFRNPFDSHFIRNIPAYAEKFGVKEHTLESLHGFYSNFQKEKKAQFLDVLLQLDESSRKPACFKQLLLTPYEGKVELLTHAGQYQKPFDGEYDLLVSQRPFLLEEMDLCRRS